MKTFRRLLLTTSLAAVACGVASANSIDFLSTPNTQGPSKTDLSYSLSLPEFQAGLDGVPANAVLTGATIYFLAEETINSLTLTNTSGAVQTFTYQSTSNVTSNSTNSANQNDAYGVNGFQASDETLNLFNSGSITLGTSGGNCPAGMPSSSCDSVTYTPGSVSNITGVKVKNADGFVGTGGDGVTGIIEQITSADLANYIGSSDFTLGGSTKTGSTFFGGGGNLGATQNTSAEFQAEIDYTYTVPSGTPEPTTMLLMGGALVGFGLFGRRLRGNKG